VAGRRSVCRRRSEGLATRAPVFTSAAAEVPAPGGLLDKVTATAPDLLPDNHLDADPASLYLQFAALRQAGLPKAF
jgi:hypothetical protein